MKEEVKNTKPIVRVSVLKPFPDITLGARIYQRAKAQNPSSLYGERGTAIIDGVVVSRHKLLMDTLFKNKELLNWPVVYLKTFLPEDTLSTFIGSKALVIKRDEATEFGWNEANIRIELSDMLELLVRLEDSDNYIAQDFFAKIIDAMNRIIEFQIGIASVFTSFYYKWKESRNG